MERMKGKVAVIVGGASGFGYACAKIFAAEGAEIVIADEEELSLQRLPMNSMVWESHGT